ncbi:MAG: AEC family transporter [Neptuniibacter sp.]
MQLIFDVVLPVFAIVLAGWASCRYGFITSNAVTALNHYVIYFAVPPMLFLATAKIEFDKLINPLFIWAFFLSSVITMLVGVFLYRGMKCRGVMDATVVALICGWGNTIYMGIPLAYFLFGDEGTLPVVIATLITNMVFIVWLSFFANLSSGQSPWQTLQKTFVGMFMKNPVLIAPILGGLVSFYSLETPKPLSNLFSMLAPSAAPVALFAMGASLVGLQLRSEMKQLTWVTMVKMVLNPLIAFAVVWYLDLDSFWAASVVMMSALPTGTMVFIFAKQHELRVNLASSAIMSTTILSLFSLSILLPLISIYTHT